MSTFYIGRARVRGTDLARGLLAIALIVLTALVAILGVSPEANAKATTTVVTTS